MDTKVQLHRRKSAPRRHFVFLACGERHAKRANIALRYLKTVTRLDIVVLRARCLSPIEHDQTIDCTPPAHFTDSQASVALKTNIHRIVGISRDIWCYLDTDVIAINAGMNRIFDHLRGQVSFAQDHVDVDTLSKYIVRCGCSVPRCNHLRIEIEKRFGVRIDDGHWRPWNGGVFVFGPDSGDFLDHWHAYTSSTLASESWHPRDQGTLAASVWKSGLEALRTLPRRFNWIVDGMYGIELPRRRALSASQLVVDYSYHLSRRDSRKKTEPACVHFINDTVGRVGWKNWDDVEALRKVTVQASSKMRPLTSDNRVVHSLWIGKHLSKLELLTLQSFVRHGHEFHLWLYDEIETPLPSGIVVEDASKIIPKNKIFTKRATDPQNGVGKGSYGPFSDLFRYKLLYEKGGYWVDMDVTCLRPFDFKAPYVFRPHNRIGVMGNIVKCPRRSRLMERAYERTLAIAHADAEWLFANRILAEEIRKLRLADFIRRDICNEDSWSNVIRPMLERDIELPGQWYAIHWINEVLRTLRDNVDPNKSPIPFVPDKDDPKRGSLLARLYEEFGLCDPPKDGVSRVNAHFSTPSTVRDQEHINILLPTLNRGGAERAVLDIVTSLPLGNSAQVFVLDRVPSSFDVPELPEGKVEFEILTGSDRQRKIEQIASRVLASPNPSLFVHMPDTGLLSALHTAGVPTIPVVQNMHFSWQAPATCFNDQGVVFVVAVSRAVSEELRAFGCRKRIVVIRHEVCRQMNGGAQVQSRELIRKQLGVPSGTVLLGMVGQFKESKNYPRAVRILRKLKQHVPAKLVILGGAEAVNATGRTSYEQTWREAGALGLKEDVITVGTVSDVEKYFAAFDVFLNTSSHEGLSVAMLEAKQAGCKIVASDVGGASEIDYAAKRLVSPRATDDEFVEAILHSLKDELHEGTDAASDGLIPFLWSAIGNYGWSSGVAGRKTTQVYLTSESALEKAVAAAEGVGENRAVIGLFGHFPVELLQRLHAKGIGLRRLSRSGSLINQCGAVLRFLGSGTSTVHFVGVDVEMRLLLAKVLSPEIRVIDLDSVEKLPKSLRACHTLQHRLCMDSSAYFSRLHASPDRM